MTREDWECGTDLLWACALSDWRAWQGLHDWLYEHGYPRDHDMYVLGLPRNADEGMLALWARDDARRRISAWIRSRGMTPVD